MKILILLSSLFISIITYAGSNDLQPFRFLAHPLDASFNIANLIATDAPRPMIDAEEGKWQLSIAPTILKVKTAYEETGGQGGGALVRGDDVDGKAVSVALGRGLSDRWQIYSLLTYVKIEGSMFGRTPGTAADDQYKVEGENSVLVANIGFGYDLHKKDSKWKSPLYFGLFVQHYDTSLTNSPLPSGNQPFTTITGDGVLLGASVGVQFSRTFWEKLSVTPYVFVGYTLSGPEQTVTVTDSNGNSEFPNGLTVTDDLDTAPFPTAGLSVGWVPWGVELSVSGPIISFYSKSIYEGLELTKFSLTFNLLQ